jgi:hypothetical protein
MITTANGFLRQNEYFMRFIGSKSVSVLLTKLPKDFTGLRAIFYNESLSQPDLSNHHDPLFVPVKRALIPTLNGLNDYNYVAWISRNPCNEFQGSFNVFNGVGRWHRSPNDTDANSQCAIPPGSAFAISDSEEASLKFCKRHHGKALIMKSMFTNGKVGGYRGYSFPFDLRIFPMEFEPITKVVRIVQSQNNVVSAIDQVEVLQHLQDIRSELYLKTVGGRVAKLEAGDPTRGFFALAPKDFGFYADDLDFQIGLRKNTSNIQSSDRGLTIMSNDLKIANTLDQETIESESLTLQVYEESFMASLTPKEVYTGHNCRGLLLYEL